MSINKINVILTFDYEVFMGRLTGTIENCVIKPVNSILKVLIKNDAKAIFFVDTAWLLFLKENFAKDFNTVADQIEFICKSGSSVGLHLHPQWLDAYNDAGRPSFKSYDNYKLHSLDSGSIINLFRKSTDLLEKITGKKITCFRAGGWCIEPFINIKEAFESVQIRYDFSVVPGVRVAEGKVWDFDFTGAPLMPFYRFSKNASVYEPQGDFIEFPLSTYNNNGLFRILNKILLVIKEDRIYGDGVGIKENSIRKTALRLFGFSKDMLTLDKVHNFVFRNLISHKFKGKDLLVMVSHPKTLSEQAIRNLNFITLNFNTLNADDLDNLIFNY